MQQDCPFQEGKISHQKVIDENGLPFPIVLLPQDNKEEFNTLLSFLHTIQNNRDWINDHLKKVGALIFRGFPVKTASDFNMVMEAFGWEEKSYAGAASRTRIEGRVHTANEGSLHQPINFHHEMALHESFPGKISFFCEIPPPDGGQTAILLSHKLTERMEEKFPELVSKIEKEGVNDLFVFPAQDNPDFYLTGWQTMYKTNDRKEAERRAANSGMKVSNVSWNGDDMMLHIGPTISIRRVDGNKKVWFNLLAFKDANQPRTLGDGSAVPREAIESCIQIAEEEAIDLKWEAGDVVVLDNRFVMHARRPSKPPRRILAAFCK